MGWLPLNDYPLLLKYCDWGLSLHQSSSGLDLPMKIIDYFSAGLPVIARGFLALPELVIDEKNGYIIYSKDQLINKIVQICNGEEEYDNFFDVGDGKIERIDSTLVESEDSAGGFFTYKQYVKMRKKIRDDND